MDDLTTTQGIVALAAAGGALVALVICIVLAVKLRRVGRDQSAVLGESRTDLVGHAASLQQEFAVLRDWVDEVAQRLDGRMTTAERRIDAAVAHHAVVRYDAYGELSGRQSTSIALLDVGGSGIVLSSILHRDQARLYAKAVRAGKGDIELSPEEADAVRQALAGDAAPSPPPAA